MERPLLAALAQPTSRRQLARQLPLPVYRPYTSDISAVSRTVALAPGAVNGEKWVAILHDERGMDPPFPSSASVPATPKSAADDRGFYRPAWRVALLGFLAPGAYELWWLWQLFAFTRRERFPHARAFWWILVPFYGLYVIFQQLDDLKKGLESLSSPVRLSAAGAIWLFIASALAGSAGNRGSGVTALGFFVLSGLLFAAVASMVQRAANAYQEARYPGRHPRGMTTGEVIATVIGVIIFALAILGGLVGG